MVDKIKHVVFDFIKSEENAVLALRGEWGIGKIHFWKEWFDQARVKKEIKKPYYSYVSLFGVNSLANFKNEIFYNIGSHNSFNLKKYMRHVKIPSIKGFSADIGSISWLAVNNTLICIDDFERHGEGLNPKDVFGIISVLKEQKNCKVVLILNDKELDNSQKDKEAYQNYREKVVDIELEFTRDISDLIKVVFDEGNEQYQLIHNAIKELNVLNIRTLFKIRNFISLIEPEIVGFPEALKNRILRSIVLFTTLYFSKPSAKLIGGGDGWMA